MKNNHSKKMKVVLLSTLTIITMLVAAYSINAQYFNERSIKAQLMMDVFRLLEGNNYGPSQISSLELAEAFMDEKQEGEAVKYIPSSVMLKEKFVVDSFGETDVYRFNVNENEKTDKLIYLHGGGNVNEIMDEHIELALHLGQELNYEVIIPIFPLVPYVKAEQMFEELLLMYSNLSNSWSDEKIILMGDSAGGGLSLSLAQQIRDKKMYQTSKIVLISPWVDISMSNPLILESLDERDYMLAAKALTLLGEYWRGIYEANNPIVSPIYGDLREVGEIILVAGSEEVLLADVHKLVLKMDRKNIAYKYYEYENMFHAFPVFGLPESKDAIDIIINDLRD
ncbi:alpha/beta hydrolase [Vibrio sp. F74]|uniref:alpha/beta hydrolase n=1 Tax=Vibrio sp. F74 TaxID=700020 RepID=UPI0035F5F1ED